MKKLRFLTALVFSCLSFVAVAEYKDGVDYKTLKSAVPTTSTDTTVGVSNIFWYGCPHCLTLAHLQESSWKKNLPADVDLHETPVIFGRPWQTHAQLYYALEQLGLIDKAHFSIFNAVQRQGHRLDDEQEIIEYMEKNYGVKPADFKRAFGSFKVRNMTQKANMITRGAQLMGVPAIVIDGRYVVDPNMAGGLENMLKITDFLVEKVRNEKKANRTATAVTINQATNPVTASTQSTAQ